MKNKNKRTFLLIEIGLFVLALCFVWKIFNQDEPEKRVAVVLPESGDNRWDSLIKGMKQSAKQQGIHLIICNTDEIENAEVEEEIINEQKNNDIEGLILWPAPGSETKKMLKKATADIPVMLVGENLYSKSGKKSGYPVSGPDYYKLGRQLGQQIKDQNQTIGIVAGWEESEASADALRGFSDTLQDCENQIRWCIYREKDQDICERVAQKEDVDIMLVLDPGALDEIGGQAEDGVYQSAEVYGIGSSVKSIALQDYGKIQGLVIPDGYEMGYQSVEEIAARLRHKRYKMKSHETGEKVLADGEKPLDDEMERFLYSYE